MFSMGTQYLILNSNNCLPKKTSFNIFSATILCAVHGSDIFDIAFIYESLFERFNRLHFVGHILGMGYKI